MTLDNKVCVYVASDCEQFHKTQNNMEKDTHNKDDKKTIITNPAKTI